MKFVLLGIGLFIGAALVIFAIIPLVTMFLAIAIGALSGI